MAAIGTAANVIAIIGLVHDVVILAKHLKGSMEEVPGNFTWRRDLAARIVKSVESLEAQCRRQGSQPQPQGLDEAVSSLRCDLQHAVDRCEEIIKPKSRFGKYGDRFNQWKNREEIKEELTSIERQISFCHQLFTMNASIRIESSVHTNHADLTKVLARIEGKLDHMYGPNRSNGLNIPPSSHHGRRGSSDRHSMQDQDLHSKVRLLSDVLSENPSFSAESACLSFITPDRHSSYAHHGRTGDPTVDVQDAVHDASALLGRVKEGISKSEVAQNLDKLSIALHDVGMDGESYETSSWAVRLYTELASEDRALYNPSLATALHNQANHLARVGNRTEEALQACMKATKLFRTSITRGRDDLNSDLALCLAVTANLLRRLGRNKDARDAAEQAVDIYNKLASDHPAVFDADLAMALNNLSTILLDLKHPNEAIEHIEAAVSMYSALARDCPDKFRPGHAASLDTYSSCLSDLRRYGDALRAKERSLEIRRKLSRDRPRVFKPSLAQSLANIFHILTALERHDAALKAIHEAVTTYRDLAHQQPSRFNPHLAISLRHKANCLMDSKRFDEAREVVENLSHIYDMLIRDDRATYEPHQATAFDMANICFSRLGRHREALQAAEQAVGIRRTSTSSQRGANSVLLATSLTHLFHSLQKLKDYTRACDVIQEVINLYRPLTSKRPDEHRESLAQCLFNASTCFSILGLHDRALDAAEDAVKNYTILDRPSTEDSKTNLARSLINTSQIMCDLGRHRDAIEAAGKASEIYRNLRQNHGNKSALTNAEERATACREHLLSESPTPQRQSRSRRTRSGR